MTADELRARYFELRHKHWKDIDILIDDIAKQLESHTCGLEIKTIDLKMWSEPGWDRVRETALKLKEEEG